LEPHLLSDVTRRSPSRAANDCIGGELSPVRASETAGIYCPVASVPRGSNPMKGTQINADKRG
jgi:hypothetical protein